MSERLAAPGWLQAVCVTAAIASVGWLTFMVVFKSPAKLREGAALISESQKQRWCLKETAQYATGNIHLIYPSEGACGITRKKAFQAFQALERAHRELNRLGLPRLSGNSVVVLRSGEGPPQLLGRAGWGRALVVSSSERDLRAAYAAIRLDEAVPYLPARIRSVLSEALMHKPAIMSRDGARALSLIRQRGWRSVRSELEACVRPCSYVL